MKGQQVVLFNDLVEKTQSKVATIIRAEISRHTGAQTKPVEEWVRVMQRDNVTLSIDHTTRKLNLAAGPEPLIELYLKEGEALFLAVNQEGGQADG